MRSVDVVGSVDSNKVSSWSDHWLDIELVIVWPNAIYISTPAVAADTAPDGSPQCAGCVPHSEWSDLHLVNMWYFRILIFAEVLAPCWCPQLRLPRAPSVSWCGHLSRIWLKHWDNTTSPHSLYLTLHTALTILGFPAWYLLLWDYLVYWWWRGHPDWGSPPCPAAKNFTFQSHIN